MTCLRLALISDTHYVSPTDGKDGTLWNRQICSRSEELAQRLVSSLRQDAVDCIIHCGDLTHEGDLSSLEFSVGALLQAGKPVHATVGNHDVAVEGARELIAQRLGMAEPRFSRAVYVGGVRFVFLDSNYAHLEGGAISPVMKWRESASYSAVGFSPHDLDWLEGELARDQASVTFIVLHHPIASKAEYPAIGPRSLSATERRGPVDQGLFPHLASDALARIERYENVKCVFAGHWHINDIHLRNGIHHIQTASLIEYPHEYRVIHVTDTHMDIRIRGIANDELTGLSLVPEWNNEWVVGNASDRERRIVFSE